MVVPLHALKIKKSIELLQIQHNCYIKAIYVSELYGKKCPPPTTFNHYSI